MTIVFGDIRDLQRMVALQTEQNIRELDDFKNSIGCIGSFLHMFSEQIDSSDKLSLLSARISKGTLSQQIQSICSVIYDERANFANPSRMDEAIRKRANVVAYAIPVFFMESNAMLVAVSQYEREPNPYGLVFQVDHDNNMAQMHILNELGENEFVTVEAPLL